MKRAAALVPLLASSAFSQCVMCFRTAAAQNAARSHVMNMGILIMGIPPVLILVGFLVLCYYRSKTYADGESVQLASGEQEFAQAFQLSSANSH
jgi:hypothetical protein